MQTQLAMNHIFNEDGKKETMDSLLKGKDSKIWWNALINELGCLAQGTGNCVISTDTINFISRSKVPLHKKVTYANFICNYRPLKEEPMRVHLTVGGNRLDYEANADSPA